MIFWIIQAQRIWILWFLEFKTENLAAVQYFVSESAQSVPHSSWVTLKTFLKMTPMLKTKIIRTIIPWMWNSNGFTFKHKTNSLRKNICLWQWSWEQRTSYPCKSKYYQRGWTGGQMVDERIAYTGAWERMSWLKMINGYN